ncbi:hypothetical protein AYO21_02789 [Fonsecaea monophora]|uniref:Uncharacterized protein n=1 Tax=Fonsecaea monophora TaxID=254056 RepID=A0A177FF71_9EURO|nr:hypothetical protein AYO21_02789 [Fonsecaea monophora]OAG42838.1 hypothetical protein AYO21_02789 [Fonsecaea monophora]
MSIALASQIIGFISFAITLATLLGVYRDLISTIRKADTAIPLMLGNLRQEIEEERALLRYRCREGDQYGVFPSLRKRTRKQREVAQLLQSSIDKIWQQFKNIERPFLIGNPLRAEQVQKGDYWGESDVEEKPRARPDKTKTRGRMELAEAGFAPEHQPHYYQTDLAHRFIWWQSRSTVEDMLTQVQRIQIRRIERDVFETDELVKRCLNRLGGRGGRGRSAHGSSSDSRGGGGGGIRGTARRNLVSLSDNVKKEKLRGHTRRVADLGKVKPPIRDSAATAVQKHGMSPNSFTLEESLWM